MVNAGRRETVITITLDVYIIIDFVIVGLGMLVAPLLHLVTIFRAYWVHGEVARVMVVAEGPSLVSFRLVGVDRMLSPLVRSVTGDLFMTWHEFCESTAMMGLLVCFLTVRLWIDTSLVIILTFSMMGLTYVMRSFLLWEIVIESSHPVWNFVWVHFERSVHDGVLNVVISVMLRSGYDSD